MYVSSEICEDGGMRTLVIFLLKPSVRPASTDALFSSAEGSKELHGVWYRVGFLDRQYVRHFMRNYILHIAPNRYRTVFWHHRASVRETGVACGVTIAGTVSTVGLVDVEVQLFAKVSL